MRELHIIGGGIAGISLGIALLRAGLKARISEAADYPRHRVCGEFISGKGQRVLESFGLNRVCREAALNRKTTWFSGNQMLFSSSLPKPAIGISRFKLDRRMADCFSALGGQIKTHSPARPLPDEPGIVWACGRRGSSREWIGLKLHCLDLDLPYDLAMHLGKRGYVGVSRLEEGKANVCGLFRTNRNISPGKSGMLIAYMKANGLEKLAEMVSSARIDPASVTATTTLNFAGNPWPGDAVCIGDANTAIPPFAGNGMSMALESADAALPFLIHYLREEASWEETRTQVRQTLRRLFRSRLAAARMIHPLLLRPRWQHPLGKMVSLGFPSFNLLHRLLR